MQVNNSSLMSFKGIYIHKPEMSKKQINLSNDIADVFYYTDAYQNSKREVDVCFLPAFRDDSVKIKFVDKINDSFVKTNKGKPIGKTFNGPKEMFKASDWVVSVLDKFNSGEYSRPEPNVKKVIAKETDAAKLRPEMYDELDDLMQETINVFGYEEDAEDTKEFVTKRFFWPHTTAGGENDRGIGYEFEGE